MTGPSTLRRGLNDEREAHIETTRELVQLQADIAALAREIQDGRHNWVDIYRRLNELAGGTVGP